MKPVLVLLAGLVAAGCGGASRSATVEPPVPAERPLPGLAAFTAEMLRHGAGERSTEQIAEAIEFLGGDLWVDREVDHVAIQARVLSEHVELAMELVADLARRPSFPLEEVEKVRRRELDRLALMAKRPDWLARRELYRELYGERHPYGRVDSDRRVIASLTREDLVAFHAESYVPRNAFLVVSGDVRASDVRALAERHFGSWPDRLAPALELPPAPETSGRRVLVVDRPGATQTQVAFGSVALARSDPAYIPARLANLVLGGNASARLFLNLRERCGYGYGVYSSLASLRGPAPFAVVGAFEAADTAGALRELFLELDRIVAEEPPPAELEAARAFMDGTFPMVTETAGNLAHLAVIQRVHGLPSDYWSRYRSTIQAVTAAEAREAARRFLRPEPGVLVLVGDAARVAPVATRYGEVRVVDPEGRELRRLAAAPGTWPGGEPPSCPTAASRAAERGAEVPQPGTPRDLVFPPPHETVLDNGLDVLTIERPALPLAYVGLVVRSGSASDPL